MKTILITGSKGFLGKHLVNYFRNKEYSIIECPRLDSNFNGLDFYPIKFDYIIHCAVKTEAGGYCQKHPGEQFLLNTEITHQILKFWKNYQPQAKFITFGSSCSYDPGLIKIEDNYMNGACEPGYETYGMVKRYLYQGLKSLKQEYGMNFTFLIPSLIYGPDFPRNDKHFIYDVLNKLIDAKKTGIKPTLWGNGHQKRELIYIDDALQIIEKSLTWDQEIINLSTGIDYSIREYCHKICKIIDFDYNQIQWDENAFVGALSKNLKNTYLQDFDFTRHEIGLKNTIDYINGK